MVDVAFEICSLNLLFIDLGLVFQRVLVEDGIDGIIVCVVGLETRILFRNRLLSIFSVIYFFSKKITSYISYKICNICIYINQYQKMVVMVFLILF